ncbi:short chain dehydrogenase/reductase like protein [Zymoseptoria brevis]|uniref:Short chain dehydrogenase/reductase like protein n=1 Tax=Zymoseptoria brevis TaxID=1047168 RepID=A0A0F4GIH5_9PEZI|nr:short chain dehydrogenase/reductase like protein [Zymoseptoria brevis]
MAPGQPQNRFRVDGLVAVITGGGTGLGRCAALALDAEGAAAVYIIGRRQDALDECARLGIHGSIRPLVGDITNSDSLKAITEQIRTERGFVNFVLANAGIAGPVHRRGDGTVADFAAACIASSAEDFTSTFDVQTTAVFSTATVFLPLLHAGNQRQNVPQDAQILITSSKESYSRQLGHSFAYSTSKAAVNHLAKMLARTFAQQHFRIRVNVVAPGFFPSEMTQPLTHSLPAYEDRHGAFSGAFRLPDDRNPSERTGSEDDFAAAILFFASPAGAYLNGTELLLDGGQNLILG